MQRHELLHLIRASAAITNQVDFVVIGSQSIVGATLSPPAVCMQSMEADIYPLNAPELADLIDGSIGEMSLFHERFGYYAQGVSATTATLPVGWKERLIRCESPDLGVAYCLDPVDNSACPACWTDCCLRATLSCMKDNIQSLADLGQAIRAARLASGKTTIEIEKDLLSRMSERWEEGVGYAAPGQPSRPAPRVERSGRSRSRSEANPGEGSSRWRAPARSKTGAARGVDTQTTKVNKPQAEGLLALASDGEALARGLRLL